jgi:hypothetical protein
MAAPLPEPKERGRSAHRGAALLVFERPAQRGAQVIVLQFEPVERRDLVGPGDTGVGVFGKLQQGQRVARVVRLGFA